MVYIITKINKKMSFVISICIILVIIVAITIYFSKINSNNKTLANENNEDTVKFIVQDNIASAELKKVKSLDAAVPIFMYHFVRDDTGDYEFPENMVRPETLKKQLQYLKDNGYETIYKDDIENLQNFTKPVWLTFDDGWEDFYINAFPLLKEYNMKASYYVITSLIGTPGYVKLDELKEMKDSGLVDIQSHTVTHPRLADLNKDNIYNELNKSKIYLKENLGIDSTTICYPYGSFNNLVLDLSKELGYKNGLAMTGGTYYTSKHKNIYAIPRIYVNRSMSMDTFKDYVTKSKVNVEWE